jgi:lysophospholipase L1-like esterase
MPLRPSLALRLFATFACVIGSPAVSAAESLKAGDHVAIIGDSITEQKLYSQFMECYLVMCQPVEGLSTTQFGWSGETSWGFVGRMKNDTLPFQPTVATTCYGMNDGGYSPMTPDKANRYREAQTQIVKGMKQAGVRFILVGSPGAVDTVTFRKNPEAAQMYNKTLAALRDLAAEVARAEGVGFANVYDAMYNAMGPAKAKLGPNYHVCGSDGFHPDQNGHLIMAYAFLKAMGCDGDLGGLTLDLASGKAQGRGGHTVTAFKDGVAQVASTRYPFCFWGDPHQPNATSGIIEFFPFNQDLNRLTLTVTGLTTPHAVVTWGKATKTFSKEQLERGVNLAAEFLDNPFVPAFQEVQRAIQAKQAFETPLHKQWMHALPEYARLLPGEQDALARISAGLVAKQAENRKALSARVKPVSHQIAVTPRREPDAARAAPSPRGGLKVE